MNHRNNSQATWGIDHWITLIYNSRANPTGQLTESRRAEENVDNPPDRQGAKNLEPTSTPDTFRSMTENQQKDRWINI